MPPVLAQPPLGSTGQASPPTANPGHEAKGDSQMREAVRLMEMSLVLFQTGSDKYKAVLDSLSKLAKVFPASAEVPGIQNTTLLAMQQKAKQSQMMQAAARQQEMMRSAQQQAQQPPQQEQVGA